jgi:hypothetical protein
LLCLLGPHLAFLLLVGRVFLHLQPQLVLLS